VHTDYRIIECGLDLHDPEGRIEFSSDVGVVFVRLRDWRNRPVVLRFHGVYRFHSWYAEGYYQGLPSERFLEVLNSSLIRQVTEESKPGEGEVMRHFVVSTSEDQWCEVVSEGFEITIDGQSVASGSETLGSGPAAR
jgi:hypothetical protein